MKREVRLFLIFLPLFLIAFLPFISASTMVPQPNKTLDIGESWSFGGSYTLTLETLSAATKQATFDLNGDIQTIRQGRLYKYSDIIYANVSSIVETLSGGGYVILTDVQLRSDIANPGTPDCVSNWTCTTWSSCSNNEQSRTCTDLNNCNAPTAAPPLTSRPCPPASCVDSESGTNFSLYGTILVNDTYTYADKCKHGNPDTYYEWYCNGALPAQFWGTCLGGCGLDSAGHSICLPACNELWQCTTWSSCSNNEQSRTCTDANTCGTVRYEPVLSRICGAAMDNPADNPADTPASADNSGGSNRGGSSSSGSGPNSHSTYYPNSSYPDASFFLENSSSPLDIFTFLGPFGFFFLQALFLFLFFLVFSLVLYIYTSLAYSSIAKKLAFPTPGIAWIPAVGPLLISANCAKMHWWPVLLLIGFIIPFVNILFILALAVFCFIWTWKTLSALNKPGWWVLFNLIPIIGNAVFLILLGVAAWSKLEPPVIKTNSKKNSNKK